MSSDSPNAVPEDRFNCEYCAERYSVSDQWKVPRILNCKHTFCHECVSNIVSDGTVECPICSTKCYLPHNNVKRLAKNQEILDAMKNQLQTDELLEAGLNLESSLGISVRETEYAEEIALGVPCDNYRDHTAVLYCIKCENQYCKECCEIIHTPNAMAKHQIVRLTEKPEPLIYCPNHPHNIAELICKQEDCPNKNEIMCTTCHFYLSHKGHDHKLIESQCSEIRNDVETCIGTIDGKRAILEKHLKDYENSISTYSTDGELVENETKRIDKIFAVAKDIAMTELQTFIKERKSKLESEMEKYASKLEEFNKLHKELCNIKKLGVKEVVKNCENVENITGIANHDIENPADLNAFNTFHFVYPNIESLAVKVVENVVIYFAEPEETARNEIVSVLETKCSLSPVDPIRGKSYLYNNTNHVLIADDKPLVERVDASIPTCVVFRTTTEDKDNSLIERLNGTVDLPNVNKIVIAVHSGIDQPRKDQMNAAANSPKVEVFEFSEISEIIDHIVQQNLVV